MTQDSVALVDLETEAHVWLARPDDIDDPRRLDDYLGLLSQAERERHGRFHFPLHQKLYLVSHALVRTTLSRYADIQPDQWHFDESEFGRPEISRSRNVPPLRFNLSHTEGLVACVVCLDIDCGIDVERMNRVKDLAGVAKRVFTSPERNDLAGREGDSLQGRFTDYWTLKEAYMKARGKGFQLQPRSFTIRIAEGDQPAVWLEVPPGFDDRADEWQFELHSLASWQRSEYRLGLALRTGSSNARRIVIRETVPN